MASITGSRCRIAFVDDDAFTLAAIRRTMRPLANEYDVEFYRDGDHFTLGQKQFLPDIVVSDNQMPLISGWQLLHSIATSHPGTVRILASGDAPQLDEVLSFSAHQCWIKPCSPAAMMDLVNHLETYREQLPLELTQVLGGLICPVRLTIPRRDWPPPDPWHEIVRRDLGATVLLSRVWGQLSADSLGKYSLDELIVALGKTLGNMATQRVLDVASQANPARSARGDALAALSQEWRHQSRGMLHWSDPDLHDLLGRWVQATLAGTFDTLSPNVIGGYLVRLWRLAPD